jgi:hypothetical protein
MAVRSLLTGHLLSPLIPKLRNQSMTDRNKRIEWISSTSTVTGCLVALDDSLTHSSCTGLSIPASTLGPTSATSCPVHTLPLCLIDSVSLGMFPLEMSGRHTPTLVAQLLLRVDRENEDRLGIVAIPCSSSRTERSLCANFPMSHLW